MEIGKLTVQVRDNTGKGISRKLRTAGMVPGVCYGVGLDTPLAVAVSPRSLKAALDPVKKTNTVLEMTLEGEGTAPRNLTAMVWDFQVHATKQNVTHVDFKIIDPTKEIETEVPIELVGKSKGSVDGGIVSWERRAAVIKARPAAVPASLKLDITPLDIGDALHVSDIPLPEGVVFVTSGELTVCTCTAPRADKNAEAAAAAEAEAAVAADPKAAAKPAAKPAEAKKDD